MALSTLESSSPRSPRSICQHCGRSDVATLESSLRSILETGLILLAGLVLALMLAPLAVITWKACTDFLSDKISHSIFYRPLEDWTRY